MKPKNLIYIVLGIVCFGILPKLPATPDPASVGPFNTADGDHALFSNTTGAGNSAFGWFALFENTTGSNNTAVGAAALDLNTGENNTAVGTAALLLNTGVENTAVGVAALETNSTGNNNTANGAFALFSDTTGHDNTAVGDRALFANTNGSSNVAVGAGALGAATGGAVGSNVAVGDNAGASLTTGGSNVFVGSTTGNNFLSGDNNTCIGNSAGGGGNAGSTGSGNVFIGLLAGQNITGGDNNICIGDEVLGETAAADSTYIGNINTTAQPIVAGVDGVTVDLTTGKLGHGVSSRRFKEQIQPMDKASEALFALKPVTFHYNKAIDPTQTLDFGLIAEDVAAVNPELAVRDREGKVSNYRHDAVNAMLLNEFLKEHRTVQEQQKEIDALKAELKEQRALIQKVSDKVELNRPAPQMAVNNQ